MRFLLFLRFRMIGNVRESFSENRNVCDWLKKSIPTPPKLHIPVINYPWRCKQCFICVIVLFSPVDNPIHPLSKSDSRIYAKKSRQLVLGYSCLLVVSIVLRIIVLRDSIIYTILIVGVSTLAGKWKYRK